MVCFLLFSLTLTRNMISTRRGCRLRSLLINQNLILSFFACVIFELSYLEKCSYNYLKCLWEIRTLFCVYLYIVCVLIVCKLPILSGFKINCEYTCNLHITDILTYHHRCSFAFICLLDNPYP